MGDSGCAAVLVACVAGPDPTERLGVRVRIGARVISSGRDPTGHIAVMQMLPERRTMKLNNRAQTGTIAVYVSKGLWLLGRCSAVVVYRP